MNSLSSVGSVFASLASVDALFSSWAEEGVHGLERGGSVASLSSSVGPSPLPECRVSQLMDPFLTHRALSAGPALLEFDDSFFAEYWPETPMDFKGILSRFVGSTKAPEWKEEEAFGLVQRATIPPEETPRIAYLTDIHGDLIHLCELLFIYQKKGWLDKEFKCSRGFYLIFLGDYCDRGCYGIEVLALLMALKRENPEQVYLLRGNHEDSRINRLFQGLGGSRLPGIIGDTYFREFVLHDVTRPNQKEEEKPIKKLEAFYRTLPLGLYLQHREVVFLGTHGIPELTFDPAPFWEDPSLSFLPVAKTRKFSARFLSLLEPDHPLRESAQKVQEAVVNYEASLPPPGEMRKEEEGNTTFCCGDLTLPTQTPSWGPLVYRKWCIPPALLCQLFKTQRGEKWDIRGEFHGHQHWFSRFVASPEGPTVVTLPGGDDERLLFGELPAAVSIVLSFSEKEGWQFQEVRRRPGYKTHQITPPLPLSASARSGDRFTEWEEGKGACDPLEG